MPLLERGTRAPGPRSRRQPVKDQSIERVSVDTTVMEKNIAHPTDARLYETARRKLVALAAEAGIELRQSYARLAPRLAAKAGGYAHARQFKGCARRCARSRATPAGSCAISAAGSRTSRTPLIHQKKPRFV